MLDRIKELLNEQGYRPATFAKKVGISQSTFSEILSGKRDINNVGVSKIIAIAEGLGVTVEELSGHPAAISEESRTDLPLLSSQQETETYAEDLILANFRKLNTEGQKLLLQLSGDLVASQRYEKKEVQDNSVSDAETAVA